MSTMQAFNATKSFENHAIIAFLESIGSEFGACQVCSQLCDSASSLANTAGHGCTAVCRSELTIARL